MAESNSTAIIDRGTRKRIPELLLMIITSVPLGLLLNQLSGILDSMGRNVFDYSPLYLSYVFFLLSITLILFWILVQRIRYVRITALVQLLIDTTKGEIPYIEFSNNGDSWIHYKPQIYLANAFNMMKLSLRLSSTVEKHGFRTWTDPSLPLENSEREERIRNEIIESYVHFPSVTDSPVSELFDRVLTDYLQNAMYVAENFGIQEREYLITHDWRDKKMGGFKASPATETELKRAVPEDPSLSILKIETLYVSDSDSRSFRVRIPQGMDIKDISSGECRGFSITGNGIALEVSYKIIRRISPDDSNLIMQREAEDTPTRVVAEQIELTTHVKMTILGFLRNRGLFNRLVRWAEEYIYNLTSEFDWPTFKARNKIQLFKRENIGLQDTEESNAR